MSDSAVTLDGPLPLSRKARWLAPIFRLGWIAGIASTLALFLALLVPTPWPMCLITPFLLQWTVLAFVSWAIVVLGQQHKKQFTRRAICGMTLITLAGVMGIGMLNRNVVARAKSAARGGDAPTIKLLAANVHSENTDYADLPRLIQREQPDVVLLTEITTGWLTAMDKALLATYPFRRAVPDDAGNFGMGVWSKTKFVEAQFELLKPADAAFTSDTPELIAMLELADESHTRVRLIGLHTLPPLHPVAQQKRDAVLRGAAERVIKQPNVPAIVMGDFNATPHCRIVREIADTARLYDATSGTHVTWPDRWSWPIMGIHIDNVLVTDDFAVESCRVGDDVGSDHWPIIVTLRLERSKS